MITCAYLQEQGQGRLRTEEALLQQGLTERGIPIRFYTPKQMQRCQLPLDDTTFLAGDMDCVIGALKQLAIPIPPPNDYPDPLRHHLHRRIWSSTLGRVEEYVHMQLTAPVFIKPQERSKRFTGCVIHTEADLYQLAGVSRRTAVICTQVVSWLSEYRVYVVNGEIRSIDHYNGDANVHLDRAIVEEGVARVSTAPSAPVGYALDYGILSTGETALIEFNDGVALGAYQIGYRDYTDVIFGRWQQLLGQKQN